MVGVFLPFLSPLLCPSHPEPWHFDLSVHSSVVSVFIPFTPSPTHPFSLSITYPFPSTPTPGLLTHLFFYPLSSGICRYFSFVCSLADKLLCIVSTRVCTRMFNALFVSVQNGTVSCTEREQCPVLDCTATITLTGDCCPRCAGIKASVYDKNDLTLLHLLMTVNL